MTTEQGGNGHAIIPEGMSADRLVIATNMPGQDVARKPSFTYTGVENLILVGGRGSSKTTSGQVIAIDLGYEFIDLDPALEEKEGKTIPEMLAIGHDYFRDRESELAYEILEGRKDQRLVVATGGGIVVRMEDNFKTIVRNGIVGFLRTRPDTALARVGHDPHRPPLKEGMTPLEEYTALYNERYPLYMTVQDFVVDTDDKTPEGISYAVMRILNQHRRITPNPYQASF